MENEIKLKALDYIQSKNLTSTENIRTFIDAYKIGSNNKMTIEESLRKIMNDFISRKGSSFISKQDDDMLSALKVGIELSRRLNI